MKQNTITLSCLLLLSTALQASVSFKPKVGIQLSQLHMGSNNGLDLPFFEKDAAVFPTDSNNTIPANTGLIGPSSTNRKTIDKDNVDSAFISQILLGLQIDYGNEPTRPNDRHYISPVANAYLLFEDQSNHRIQADRFIMTPLFSGGIDLGLQLAHNGSYLQIGAGGQLYRADISSGLFIAAMAQVESTDPGDIDTTILQKSNSEPYTASLYPTVMPYVYSEANTEIGDTLSIFAKVSYGLETTPADFGDVADNLEMFGGDANAFAANSKWKIHTASIGIKIRLSDLI